MHQGAQRAQSSDSRAGIATPGPCRIDVTGDVAVDWMLVVPTNAAPTTLERSYQWDAQHAVQVVAQPGSAPLLCSVIAACASHLPPNAAGPVRVLGPDVPPAAFAAPGETGTTRTFAVWQPYPTQTGSHERVWRMHEYLGRRPGTAMPIAEIAAQGSAPPVCLAIDDTALSFRQEPALWPAYLRAEEAAPAHVILKMANPLATGPLWEALIARHADALTVYCSVNDLRKEFAPIGQPLSWERTSSDIVKAVIGRPDLARARRVIVSLGLSGAVMIERGGARVLVFDPMHQEGDWEGMHPGTPFGLGTCMVAALAIAAARTPTTPDWAGAIQRGLATARALHERGYLLTDNRPEGGFHFPLDLAAASITSDADEQTFQRVRIPDGDQWDIFTTSFSEGYRAIAARIALEGDAEACRGMPVERMGAWASVDRTEIESMRSVRNIIREYLAQTRRARPLSLAVFGPPGAGKSFAIKQMAREWTVGGAKMTVLEFNLSQFASASALPAALQRVRDCAVEQSLPLVFWDEFDTALDGRPLGWLSQFLAPMQDGAFVEDGVVRPIGPAIFIFAGGTHATMEIFQDQRGRTARCEGDRLPQPVARLRRCARPEPDERDR